MDKAFNFVKYQACRCKGCPYIEDGICNIRHLFRINHRLTFEILCFISSYKSDTTICRRIENLRINFLCFGSIMKKYIV